MGLRKRQNDMNPHNLKSQSKLYPYQTFNLVTLVIIGFESSSERNINALCLLPSSISSIQSDERVLSEQYQNLN